MYGKEDPAIDPRKIETKKNPDYEIDMSDYENIGIMYDGTIKTTFNTMVSKIDGELAKTANSINVQTHQSGGRYGRITFKEVYTNDLVVDTSVGNAVMQNNNLIIRPGTSVDLSTKWENERSITWMMMLEKMH